MTKIIHFGKYYLPDVGGIESVTVSLAKGSVLAGNDVTVVCFGKKPAPQRDIIDGVQVVRIPIKILIASQPLSFKYFYTCLTLAKSSNIVHLHAPNILGALCALMVGRKTRLVVHWHSDIINKGLLGRFVRPLEKFLLKRADIIIATSKIYADASAAVKPFLNKVKVIPIGVPDIKSNKATSPPRFINDFAKGRRIILAVGRLVPYKGFDVLIKATCDISKEAVVVIVGGGPLQETLQRAITHSQLDDRVMLAGRLGDDELHMLFRKAYLYCMPSTFRAEAFGVVLVEAMSYGLPIVATEISGSGVPWVNMHNQSGFNVPVNNPQKLAAACNLILETPELHKRLSNGSRQRFSDEFTEEIALQRVLKTYKNLTENAK